MARTWTLPVALLVASGLTAQSTWTLTVHFPVDEATVPKTDEAALRALCDRPDRERITAITLKGHTDVRGSIGYNDALSARRAEAVRSLLGLTCLHDRPVTVSWAGEHAPVDRTDAEPVHAANRRVDIELTFAPEPTTAARPDAHPTVRPLLPGIDKPRERHAVDPRAPIDVTMSDGVRVRIPAGAIVRADGTPVEATVDLSYRSFGEPYEIIASGIPMHLRTGTDTKHFETAGMYELYALQGDERLALAPGSEITLQRPDSAALGDDFTGWRLDPENGAWAAGGTLSATPIATAPATASGTTEATVLYWNRLWDLESEKRPDTTLFAARRKAGNYCHLAACDTAAPGRSWTKRRDRFDEQAGVPAIQVVAYKGIYDPDHIVFTIDMDRTSDKHFPEWRRLPYPAIWEYRGDASKAMFKRLYGRRHKYQDLVLDLAAGENDGVLRLKENGEWLAIPVSARWNRDTPARAAHWDHTIGSHDKALAKREAQFDKQVMRRTERYRREHRDTPATAWKHARRAMNATEEPMDLATWRTYADTRRPVVFRSNMTMQRDLASVRTAFGLQDFGVYNIDRIMKMADQQNVLANAVDADGKPFPWVNGFAVLTNENSVITYWGSGSGAGDNFLVSPGRMKSLFLVDAEGRIARADVSPLNSRTARVTLRVEPLGDPKDIEAFRATAQR